MRKSGRTNRLEKPGKERKDAQTLRTYQGLQERTDLKNQGRKHIPQIPDKEWTRKLEKLGKERTDAQTMQKTSPLATYMRVLMGFTQNRPKNTLYYRMRCTQKKKI